MATRSTGDSAGTSSAHDEKGSSASAAKSVALTRVYRRASCSGAARSGTLKAKSEAVSGYCVAGSWAGSMATLARTTCSPSLSSSCGKSRYRVLLKKVAVQNGAEQPVTEPSRSIRPAR